MRLLALFTKYVILSLICLSFTAVHAQAVSVYLIGAAIAPMTRLSGMLSLRMDIP